MAILFLYHDLTYCFNKTKNKIVNMIYNLMYLVIEHIACTGHYIYQKSPCNTSHIIGQIYHLNKILYALIMWMNVVKVFAFCKRNCSIVYFIVSRYIQFVWRKRLETDLVTWVVRNKETRGNYSQYTKISR